MIAFLLSSTAGCSDEYKYRDRMFTITGKLVDYKCRPISHTDVYALNSISSPGAYGIGGASINNTATTDAQGYFNIDLYEGERVYLGTGKNHKLFKTGNILQSYDNTALKNLRTVAGQDGDIVIYTRPTLTDEYRFDHFVGWLKKPRGRYTFKKDLISSDSSVFLKSLISQSGAVGLKTFSLSDYIDIRIKSVDVGPDAGYKVTIQGRENVGLLKAIAEEDQSEWDVPEDGYNDKYIITFPYANYPYEMDEKWKHGTYYIKAQDGVTYAVVSFDIGLVSSFDAEHHDKHSTEDSWEIAVWAMADIIRSEKYGYGNKKYRHRLPITSPVIPRKTCGGDFKDTHSGSLGRHPQIYQQFFYKRKSRQDYMLKEINKR